MTTSSVSDADLFNDYRHGNIKAFDALYQRYRQPLYLFLLRRGHSESSAEDVFHDTWLRVIDHHDSFEGGNFRAWLYGIARNLSTDGFRREKIRQARPIEDDDPGSADASAQTRYEALDCIELIKASVAALPIEQRDVFLLKQEAGLSLEQIAELMAVGRETIKSRIRYAMQRLKQLMEECL
jgi:RNA polymerase sigma-70 factor (ECF subfamily)